MVLGAVFHCHDETCEFELVTLRGIKGNMEILGLAQVWLPLYSQVIKDLFYPYQPQSTFTDFMTAIC